MKKISILLCLTIGLYSCHSGSKSTANISGEIKGLGNDTLYLYGADKLYDRTDTILVKDGKFKYTAEVDTLTSALLLIGDSTEYPVFLDKGNKIDIKGNINNPGYLEIKGNMPNEEFTAYRKSLQGLAKPSEKALQEKAEEFIRTHNSSFVSVYLLDKYFVQKQNPDLAKIKQLIQSMSGTLLDKPEMIQVNAEIDQIEKAETGKVAPLFNLRNTKGEMITLASEKLKDKYRLVCFWASWCDSCRTFNAELRKVYNKYKKEKDFVMLGVSLDMDKKVWKSTIKSDTLSWEQAYALRGIESEIATQYAIRSLPATVLIDPQGKIIAKDLPADSLSGKLKTLLAEEKAKKAAAKVKKIPKR